MITAFSYLELVTKYPQAAGAALYTHKAFGIHFVTFIVAFTVMCSGITSASTASRAFAVQPRRRASGSTSDNTHPGARHRAGASCCWSRRSTSAGSARASRPTSCSPWSSCPACCSSSWSASTPLIGGQGRLLAGSIGVRQPERQERLPRRHGGDLARLLRDGRLRGLGQHGRGDQGPGAQTSRG